MIKNEIIDIFKMNDDIVVQALQNIPEQLIVNEDTKDFKALKDAVNRKFQKSRQENNANLAILLLKKFGGLIEACFRGPVGRNEYAAINWVAEKLMKNKYRDKPNRLLYEWAKSLL